ncbi:MAG: hydantoinase/oxoprolinase family protein [Candidatus Dormibacteraceae bacterium]
MSRSMLAVDVGGTFTDVVLLLDGKLLHAKTFTTPERMQEGVQAGIKKLLPDASSIDYLFHGTTAVINALLERKGALTGLLTTAGFRDVLELGRGSRSDPFDMLFASPPTLVPRRWRCEVPERVDAHGSVLVPISREAVLDAVQLLVEEGISSLAICFLNSYANPEHERYAADWIRERWPALAVTISTDLVREWREYERSSTAVMNAYVKPMMMAYLDGLTGCLDELKFPGRLQLLQSNGGSTAPAIAREQPLRLLESGPASGITGVAVLARRLRLSRVVGFDMGGTTAKAGIVRDYAPATVRPYYVGSRDGMPSLLPVVDLTEVGAGGGSIAYIDEAGALKVGPRSAGAEPGPVCYGRGGVEPTISDAHVVLGRINPDRFLGGELELNVKAAAEAFDVRIGRVLGTTAEEAAVGVLRVANNKMAMLLREVSLFRGHDPRELTMVATGGAGPLHAAEIARELSIPSVVIPPWPAHFGALGMLHSDVRHEYTQSLITPLSESVGGAIAAALSDLEVVAHADAATEGIASADLEVVRYLELCYVGQENTLAVPLSDADLSRGGYEQIATRFHEMHSARYGFMAPTDPIRAMGVRLETRLALVHPELAQTYPHSATPSDAYRRAYISGTFVDAPVIDRAALSAGASMRGPAIIEEPAATTVLGIGDVLTVDEDGDLIISVNRNAS